MKFTIRTRLYLLDTFMMIILVIGTVVLNRLWDFVPIFSCYFLYKLVGIGYLITDTLIEVR